ncbi:efflux RND transporter periplasmic adaptor subunit [Acidimangrovimonas pyrenivorans]|uniref:Efflux RND transporter periplasmic adaptor subunit n=1 Tax=Acidimangrovimonas pyrenivorans TaxID=2030798 RepID=A0ABV7AL13_9RHOB
MRRLAPALILSLALPLALCSGPGMAEEAPPRPVVSEVVTPQSGLQPSYVGTVTARVETDLGFPRIGTVAERTVRLGDVVKKGEVLARQDPTELDADLRAAEAGVTVAEAQAKSARDAARRVDELVARGVDSAAAAQTAHSSLAAAEAQLEQARAALARARDARDLAVLKAPQDGVITHVYAEPGATLAAGRPVLRLAGTDQREIVIDLTEQDVAGLSPGAVFHVRLEAAPQIEAEATLRAIDPIADPATRTRRLHLSLDPVAPIIAFRLGALALVEPVAETHARTTLPVTALIGGAQGDKGAVWVVTRTADKMRGTVHRTAVTLGERAGDRVLILSGIKPGDEVVTKGVNSIADGQAVGPELGE